MKMQYQGFPPRFLRKVYHVTAASPRPSRFELWILSVSAHPSPYTPDRELDALIHAGVDQGRQNLSPQQHRRVLANLPLEDRGAIRQADLEKIRRLRAKWKADRKGLAQ